MDNHLQVDNKKNVNQMQQTFLDASLRSVRTQFAQVIKR